MFRRRRSRFAEVIRSSIVLHLKSGESVAGVLLAEYDDVVAIAQGRLLGGGDAPTIEADGETLVPLSNIRFAQVGVTIDDWRGRAAHS